MVREIRDAYNRIRPFTDAFHENISYMTPNDFEYEGSDVLSTLISNDLKTDLEDYLAELKSSPVRTLEELVAWNTEHADVELPPHAPSQSTLEDAIKTSGNLSKEAHEEIVTWTREAGRAKEIDHYLKKYDLDVIIGPADCKCTEPAAAAGYPLGAMPLSYLETNGRPFGVSIVATAGHESKILQAMSAWEATFAPHKPPPILER